MAVGIDKVRELQTKSAYWTLVQRALYRDHRPTETSKVAAMGRDTLLGTVLRCCESGERSNCPYVATCTAVCGILTEE